MKRCCRLIVISIIFLIPLSLTGCSHIAVANAQKEMQVAFDALMGSSEEDIVMRIGVPKNINHLGDLTIYHYYQSYGTRSNAYSNASGYSAYGSARSWEAYDQAEIVFKNGRAISWKGYVQR